MSLYLCVFDGDEEVDGIEVGPYSEYGSFLDSVIAICEAGSAGSKFPILTQHSDSDGQWSVSECRLLEGNLQDIAKHFRDLPPRAFPSPAQAEIARQVGLVPSNLSECFVDVDGELLLERLIGLARTAQRVEQPILFQ